MEVETDIENELELDDLCKALLDADPDIQDIVLFGSYVYAPSLACDIDLLVATIKKKPYDNYYNAVADFPIYVDLIIKESGEIIGDRIAWGLKSTGQVLIGSGKILLEAMKIPMVTFERARKILLRADENFLSAKNNQDADIKDEAYRDSFNKLFDVARNSVMAYLGIDETRWGKLKRELPEDFQERFNRIINTLHIVYSYQGGYPKDGADEEFMKWRTIIEQFVNDLEQDS
jgi:predicted nucleotidyltransferase